MIMKFLLKVALVFVIAFSWLNRKNKAE